MRWKTSCCGIDPSIMVTQAPMKVSHRQGSGKEIELARRRGVVDHRRDPPVMPETRWPMYSIPPMMTPIWTKSRIATDSMPPRVV